MNKRALVRKIVARLTAELELHVRAALYSRAEATHEQNKSESKYDTRGLEASYLARGQSMQVAELQQAIVEYQKLEVRKFAPGERIGLGAIVELEVAGEAALYFIGPRAGGTEVVQDRKEILVITPPSPLGAQLLGHQPGERLQLMIGGRRQAARILSVQ